MTLEAGDQQFGARFLALAVNSFSLAGLTAADGRVVIMMPHPERVFRAYQNAWRDPSWQEDGPWMRLFRNARVALG